ncbi:hypothetical protein EDC04DRAFT_2579988 [Pisolithus marmoratus]|nr:hypothetical protein EDC04DRAFT_2579988 [Pisolithus marmoratus]
MSFTPQRPPPPPDSENPTGGPGGSQGLAVRDAQQEATTPTRTEPRFPEQAHISTPHASQTGHDGGDESDKNLLESAEGPSSGGHVRGQPNPFEPRRESTPPTARSRDGHPRMPRRATVLRPATNASEIDWIVPVDKPVGVQLRKTFGERIQPTIDAAKAERQKANNRATNYALNIAIGLQVFLGALTTGVAAAVSTGKQASGLSTLVASYLARARGSGEPEVSGLRVRDLDHFLRDCEAFKLDHAHETTDGQLENQIHEFRQRLEIILGGASGCVN